MSTPVSLQVSFIIFYTIQSVTITMFWSPSSSVYYKHEVHFFFFFLQISYGIRKHIFFKGSKPPLNFAAPFVPLLLQHQLRRRRGSVKEVGDTRLGSKEGNRGNIGGGAEVVVGGRTNIILLWKSVLYTSWDMSALSKLRSRIYLVWPGDALMQTRRKQGLLKQVMRL